MSLTLQHYLDFLNTVLYLGKEYEDFGCSPRSIQCYVSKVDEKSKNIWLKPIKTAALDNELEGLCQSFLESNCEKENLDDYSVGNIGLCVTTDGDLIGRGRIVGINRKGLPVIQCIDTGIIYGSLDKSCIYKLHPSMTKDNFAFPLCFVAKSLPAAYLNKYRMLGATDIHVGDFVNVNIINVSGTIVHAIFSLCNKIITSVKYNYIGLDAFGDGNIQWSRFCDSNKYQVGYKDNCQIMECHKITDANTDGYVVGIPDEETIYVRSVSLSIAYCCFLDALTSSYSVEEFNKLLYVHKVVPDDIMKTFVFFDSVTMKFYRVELTGVSSEKFSCYCIDQPSLLFLDIDNKPDILWRLSTTFALPRFYCEVKLGDLKSRTTLMGNNKVSLRRITTLKNLFKENNLVTVERRTNKKFLTVRHEGLDVVERYKNIMLDTYHDKMDATTNTSGVFKEPSLRKKGAFASSMNESFKGKGKVLGQSLKAQCSMKITSYNSKKTEDLNKDGIFEFGSFKPKGSYVNDSTENSVSNYIDDEHADELCEYVDWNFGCKNSRASKESLDLILTESLKKLSLGYNDKTYEKDELPSAVYERDWARPSSNLSNSTTTSGENTRNCRAVRFKDVSFNDSSDANNKASCSKDPRKKSPDVSDCDSGLSYSGISSTENINHLDGNSQNNYLKKKLKCTERYAVVNICSVDDIRIFDLESLNMYLSIHDTLMGLDDNQLERIEFGKTMPDTMYILEYKNERYRVFVKDNYMNEDDDSDSDQSHYSESCNKAGKNSENMDVIFVEYDTKQQFTFNCDNCLKIYKCPDEIRNLKSVPSEVVSLAGEHRNNSKIRNYIHTPEATEYLRSLLPPFEFKTNANIKFSSDTIAGKKTISIRNSQGRSLSPLFSAFCHELAECKK
uniref:Tudor domain-containing protein n=1 Tax=Strongyloides stercoralis TaxID=6248 RepID=A0A0K0EEL3_STRER